MFLFGANADNAYHSEEEPPPFHENQEFDFGLDNKSIRRAFIRKVSRSCGQKQVKEFLDFEACIEVPFYCHLICQQQPACLEAASFRDSFICIFIWIYIKKCIFR